MDAAADQLTEADAEAVLLALGEPLRWKQETRPWYLKASCDAGEYHIYKFRHGLFSHVYRPGLTFKPVGIGPIAPAAYKQLADAQTACERHRHTGRWGAGPTTNGEVLEWYPLTNEVTFAHTPSGEVYRVFKKKQGRLWKAVATYQVGYRADARSPQRGFVLLSAHDSQSEAKAACERHHATGKGE